MERIKREETTRNASERFGWGHLLEIAYDVFDRMEDVFEDGGNELWSALDNELIYYSQQWEVISSYINPREIGDRHYYEIIEEFYLDLYDCLEVEEIEEGEEDED